jgi:hypothetical protein
MARVYYRKKQEEKCDYCKNIENQANILERNINMIQKFKDNHKVGALAPSNEVLTNDQIQAAYQLEPLKRKVAECKFPYCGSCRVDKD